MALLDQDKSVMHALKELGSGVNLQGDKWEKCDGLVLFRGKVYVPLDTQLWHDIVEAHHDTPVTGHLGWWKMTKLVACNYWWPGMGYYIAKYVKGCNICNQMKSFLTAPVGKLMPNSILYHQWQIISVDLSMELPQSHGYDSILVTVDRLSKQAHFIATMSNITLLGITPLFGMAFGNYMDSPRRWIVTGVPSSRRTSCMDSARSSGLKSRLHGLPPAGGWPNQMCQPGGQAVPMPLHKPETG